MAVKQRAELICQVDGARGVWVEKYGLGGYAVALYFRGRDWSEANKG